MRRNDSRPNRIIRSERIILDDDPGVIGERVAESDDQPAGWPITRGGADQCLDRMWGQGTLDPIGHLHVDRTGVGEAFDFTGDLYLV